MSTTTSDSHPVFDKALATIFTSSARVAVLRIFMLDPTREYYQRQIETATGLPIRAVQRELERLTASGLLYRRQEGNRTYYLVDQQFPLFPELRGMLLKSVSPEDRFRGQLAMLDAVRLVFHDADENRMLVVTEDGTLPVTMEGAWTFAVDVVSVEEFVGRLAPGGGELESFLARAVDLLGRRDDVLWRRIESAGHAVRKGRGVA